MRQMAIIVLCILLFFAGPVPADVWKDDFEEDNIGEDWTSATWLENAPPDWKVEGGILKGSWPHSGSAQMLFLEEYPSLDYTIQVRCRIDRVWQASQYAGPGIVFRSSGPAGNKVTPFYAFGIVGFRALFFMAQDDANWRDADVTPGNYNIDQWYTLKLVVSGRDFLAYVDDKLICELRDRQFKDKFVGLVTGEHADVSFDDFMITDRVDDVDFPELFDVSPVGMVLTTTWASMKTQ